MKMTIGITLNAKMKPRNGRPVFSPSGSIGPASHPNRKPAPWSAKPMARETPFENDSSACLPGSQ